MITLTKEWLLKTIAELEEERDATPGAVNEDAAMALAAMKLALASLEAEPVCVIDQSNLDYLNSGSDADVWPASRKEMGDVLLYRAAPPASVSVPTFEEWCERTQQNPLGWVRDAMKEAYDGCRATMLQAGTPVQFGWSKGHFGYHTLFNAIGKAVNIQEGALSISVSAFEDAMLAAAPQQEVK